MHFTEGNPYSILDQQNMEVWSRGGVQVAVEHAPRELISHVDPNLFARKLLPQEFSYLTNPDWLVAHTFLSVPHKSSSSHTVAVPWSWGRAISVEYGRYPYGVALGGVIQSKGNWATGLFYDNIGYADGYRAPGLFEGEGAGHERRAANALLARGFRAALPLGDVYMDANRMEQWIVARWPDHRWQAQSSFAMLRDEWGETPVVSFFVGGVTERVGARRPESKRRQAVEMRVAAMLMREEFALRKNGNESIVFPVLTKIIEDKALEPVDLDIFMEHAIHIFVSNARALEKTVATSGLRMHYEHLSEGKDVCLALITNDFEQAFEGAFEIPETDDIARRYLVENAAGSLRNFKEIISDANPVIPLNSWDTLSIRERLLERYEEGT